MSVCLCVDLPLLANHTLADSLRLVMVVKRESCETTTSNSLCSAQSGVRPFGVSLLICGWDEDRPYLFQCDPSGAYFAWKATAMGKNFISARTFLEKRYSEDLELDDAVHTAILTLKEGFEGQMTADNIEVGVCDASGFRRLDPSSVKDYLANIP
ncbi:Proteasome subunit alpha type-2 [Homalodisca vitripennis]|nr:Proteasome subunit alpha type-2 [Homalodisca vitripennis]